MTVLAGAAVVDVTPPAGLHMAGFGVRTAPATGHHDPLTARALVVGDTALLVVDVIGLDAQTCRRIRMACGLPSDHVLIAASHTHGGPHTMPGRMGDQVNAAYLQRLEAACIEAIAIAAAARRPSRILSGQGDLPGVARNRRHADGPVDTSVPVLRVEAEDGSPIALLFSFACHPVVLDGTNHLWTGDYPHHARRAIEAANPGAIAIFATGCAGDVNTGHSSQSSLSLNSGANRSHADAARVGERVANAAMAVALRESGPGPQVAAHTDIALQVDRLENGKLDTLVTSWKAKAQDQDAASARIHRAWLDWAMRAGRAPLAPYSVRVAALRWGDVPLVAMPGEIFAQTALDIRSVVQQDAFVLSYCDDNPGYIAPAEEFAHGGYEIEEAHRYYGMPGTFRTGGAEGVRDAALLCIQKVLA